MSRHAPEDLAPLAGISNGDVLTFNKTLRRMEWSTGGGGGGETNTASNQGASGVGVFDAKVSVDLQFHKLEGSDGVSVGAAASNIIPIKLDITNLPLLTGLLAVGDEFAMEDISLGSQRKATLADLLAALNALNPAPVTELNDLTDVSTSGVALGDFIVYTGSAWGNRSLAATINLLGTVMDLGDLANVTAGSPTSGDHLEWNGSAWINAVPSGGGGAVPLLFGVGVAALTAKATTEYRTTDGTNNGTEASAQFKVRRAGTIQNLDAYVSASSTGANSTVTVRKNGVGTTLGVTFGAGVTGWLADAASSFTVVAGDLISVEIDNTSSGGGSKDLTLETVTFELA